MEERETKDFRDVEVALDPAWCYNEWPNQNSSEYTGVPGDLQFTLALAMPRGWEGATNEKRAPLES